MATRWAICGAGMISNDFCGCINSLPKTEHEIVAVAARDPEKATQFAKKFNIPRSCGSYKELAEIPDVDVIYVGIIHPFHVETCLMFINAGKNVLCEKPLSLTYEGCQRMLTAAQEKGVFFMEGWWSRFFPVYKLMQEQIIEKHVLGDVKMVEAAMVGSGNIYHNDRQYKWKHGGGALTDIGVYGFHAAAFFFPGRPSEVKAVATFNENGNETSAMVLLKYPGDKMASITTSIETKPGASSLMVRGTEGNAVISDFMWCPTRIELNGQLKEFATPEATSEHSFIYPNGSGMMYEIQAVRECLLKGQKECPVVSHEHSDTVMWILDAVCKELGIKYHNP